MINILFFGQLKERLNQDKIKIDLSELSDKQTNVANLRNYLQKQNVDWLEFLQFGQALVAVNQEIATEETEIADNDEVAFFPPVTGG
ncbi:molybdopterin converting factor subunit 1 [Paraglaciecola sp. L3A3]|uniref:molybdopterin converting factor subunit 1 n=1 Tax=Paraglaciecola sp. L3A3 TaxID=2686358 RepID=UPI00131DB505|nr:molybdopterin converting factor subunit 1 [Paraglaciecola sp. L3A3]